MADDDYTLMTTESMALVLNADGCCVRHPSIRLKEVDKNGDVFLKEACPQCQSEFAASQNALLEKRREIASRLQELNVPADEEEQTEASKEEKEEDDASVDSSSPALPPAMAPLNTDHLTLESLAAHMLHIQQMQDILMFQKDKEVAELKKKVEEQQTIIMEKQVEIAVLKERMSTQKHDMEKELKLIKKAVAMDRERRGTSGSQASSTQQEIHIDQLHVHKIPGDTAAVHDAAAEAIQREMDDQQDFTGDRVVVVKGVQNHAAVASASTASSSDDKTPDVTNGGAAAVGTAAAITMAGAVAATSTKDENAPITMAAAAAAPPSKEDLSGHMSDYDDEEEEKPPAAAALKKDIEFVPTKQEKLPSAPSRVKEMAAKLNESESFEFVPDDGLHPARFEPKKKKEEDELFDLAYVPDKEETPRKVAPPLPNDYEDQVESEEEDEFDMANLPALDRKPTPSPYQLKPGPLTKQRNEPLEDPNEHRKEPLEASMSSLKPPGSRLQAPSSALPTMRDLPENHGAGAAPLDEFNFDSNAPPMVPLEEQVTLASEINVSDRFTPNVVGPDDEGTVGVSTVGPTVASSTYGEDRIKVQDQLLLDPYGDKGIYTGQVLISTGLPHGSGKMIYEDDGRTYDGDWRHGRWNGWGRATFSNGDAFEGFYKYDQRHGHGKYSWKDGRVYEGDFKEDKRWGRGVFTWPDGARFEGDFVNGQREGKGSYTFSDGGCYDGEWINGRYEGQGVCRWADGRVYKGEWKAGMAHGIGTETYPDGRVRHSGKWVKDEPIRD